MKKRKNISAAIVLSGAVLFVVIVNLPSGGNDRGAAGGAQNPAGNDAGLQFQVNQNRNVVANPTPAGGSQANTDNLSDRLAQNLSQNILQLNNGFNQGTSTITLPSSDSLGEMISSSTANQALRFPAFNQKDIRIGSDNSTAAQLAYLKSVGDITTNNFGAFKTPILDILNNFFNKNDSTGLAKYVDIAGKEVGDFLALNVPEQLSAWHLQNLNLWEKKLVVYKAILNLNDDPLKAILAIQEIGNVGQENQNLQDVINGYAQKLGV